MVGAVLARLVLPHVTGEPVYGFGESLVSADASGTVREAQFRIDPESESSLNRELRLLVSAGATGDEAIDLFDGAHAEIAVDVAAATITAEVAAGDRFDVFTLDLDARDGTIPLGPTAPTVSADGNALPAVGDGAALEACAAPGCWWWDAAASRLQARVWASGGPVALLVSASDG